MMSDVFTITSPTTWFAIMDNGIPVLSIGSAFVDHVLETVCAIVLIAVLRAIARPALRTLRYVPGAIAAASQRRVIRLPRQVKAFDAVPQESLGPVAIKPGTGVPPKQVSAMRGVRVVTNEGRTGPNPPQRRDWLDGSGRCPHGWRPLLTDARIVECNECLEWNAAIDAVRVDYTQNDGIDNGIPPAPTAESMTDNDFYA